MGTKTELRKAHPVLPPNIFIGIVLIIAIFIVVVALGEYTRNRPAEENHGGATSPVATTTSVLPARKHSPPEAEVREFVSDHLQSIVADGIVGGKYPLPEINDRYRALLGEVMQRYGTAYAIGFSTEYNKDSDVVLGGSVAMPTPTVILYVPAAMDVYKAAHASNETSAEKKFETAIVIAVMHELDHLAKGWILTSTESKEGLVELESMAWSETCAHTIAAFKKHEYPLSTSEAFYYKAWETCGKKNNECWKAAMRRAYAGVLQNMS